MIVWHNIVEVISQLCVVLGGGLAILDKIGFGLAFDRHSSSIYYVIRSGYLILTSKFLSLAPTLSFPQCDVCSRCHISGRHDYSNMPFVPFFVHNSQRKVGTHPKLGSRWGGAHPSVLSHNSNFPFRNSVLAQKKQPRWSPTKQISSIMPPLATRLNGRLRAPMTTRRLTPHAMYNSSLALRASERSSRLSSSSCSWL